VGRECKRYLEVICKRGRDSVRKQPCPYEDCGCERVWYWGWFERKEGSIPYGDGSISNAIPIRRFRCSACGRTFSWRPHFLVRWRRFAAIAYEQAFKDWAFERHPGIRSLAWCAPGAAARKRLRRQWEQRAAEFFRRSEVSSLPLRGQLRQAIRNIAYTMLPTIEKSRFSSHYLLIAFARHPTGSFYSLAAS
jgi:hypothetical protein